MPEDSSYVWFHIGKAYSFLMSERQPRATDMIAAYNTQHAIPLYSVH